MKDINPSQTNRTHSSLWLIGALLAGVLVDVGLLIRFPYLFSNVPILVLALATPLLVALVGGMLITGMRAPRGAIWGARGALALVALVDLIVFAGPLVIRGATGHDTTPQFTVALTATATTAPQAMAAPTQTPLPGPFTFTFNPRTGEGATTGTAILGIASDGKALLRLQGFHTGNGPNLHIFLSHAATPTTDAQVRDGFDLGPLTATDGDKNYPVPAGVDITTIHSVVIYCESFNALFGYATR